LAAKVPDYRLVLGLLSALMLGACSTLETPSQTPVVVEDRAVVNGRVLPLPDEPVISSRAMSNQHAMSPVAKKLLLASESQRSAGDWEAAANSLERALRIEPRNALLWSRLADVRYEQRDWQQAVQLAAKSNTLVGNNKDLRRQNWYLMSNAYQAQGNLASAQKFRDKLSQ